MSVDNIETEKHLRRCERKNRGLPPNRYGWENQSSRSVVNSEQQITGNSQQAKVNEANFSNLHGGTSSRRSKASKISESSFKRRQLEADLAADIEKAELEEQRDNLEIQRELKRIERQQFLTERRRELNQAILAEQLEENGRKTPDNISVNSLFQENIFENKSVHSEVDNLEKIENWLHDQGNHDSNVISIQNLSQAFAEAIKMGTAIATKNVDVKNDNDMKKFLARQSTAKDLPIFSGDPEDWTNFISQFNRSTEVCGFSAEENMYRLQKCLTGKARDAVQAMMISPEHTHEVIEVLKTNFGRPEYVIKSLIERAKHTAVIKEDKFEMIVEFSNVVRNLTITMEILKCTGHMNNPMLIEVLVGKLPPNLRLRWGEMVATNMQATTLKDFSEWLNVIAKAASCISTPALIEYKGHQSRKGKETILATTTVSKQKKKLDKNSICLFCEKQDHDLSACKLFQKEDATKRWKWAAEKKICFSCLKEGHQAYRCFKRKTCEKEGCTKKHHPLLHVDELSSAQTTSNSREVVINTTQVNLEKTVLLRIAPVILRGPLGCLSTYALFDEASTVTLIDSDVADRLGMTGTTENLSLRWTTSEITQECDSKRVSCRIQPADGEESFNLTNVRTIKNLELPVQSIDMRKISAFFGPSTTSRAILKNISVSSMNRARPTILLGQDNIDLIIAREVIEGPKNAPVVSRTKLGWIVHGNISFRHRVDEEFLLHISHKENECDDDSLHQLVKDSFKLDMVGVKKATEEIRSKEDRRAIQILEDTSRRVGDRWETGILWKEDEISLGKFNSKAVAASRLHGIEKKMDKDPNFAQQYCEKIDEYIGKNYARKISTEEAATNDDRKVWYLPHFGVTNPNKPGKFRLVFDAAAKCRGTSINDVLLQGPDLLNSLMGILLRFRQRKIAFSADIKEMFHQILIRREDSMVQRFLWRGRDRTRAPDIMEMAVMIFGSVSSPYQAQEIKNRNAREFQEEYPEAAAAIIQRHYMDDYLDSTNTEEEAMKIISEVIQIHRKGGFQICNWISSSREVLRSIPKEFRAIDKQDRNLDSELAIERVLGLHWNPNDDVFIFICKFNKIDKAILIDSRRPTKREVLRTVMSIFDPIGFLTCFTVKAKILLQDIWRSNIGWDDELSTGCWEKWHKWKRELMIIPSIHIPRCYSVEMIRARGIQLHVFCDASEKAYAAVAYLRIDIGDDIHTAFVTAKSRVAPLRPMSIPRLELQAAVLASRLSQAVVEQLDIKIEKKFYWTDSQTVLYWLRSDARKYKTFVAHRIAEIGELTKVTEWNWVSTSHNVADEATRDGNGMNLSSESRWLNGPQFLKSEESKWFEDVRKFTKVSEEELEMKKEYVCLNIVQNLENLPNIERFSSWLRLIRATAWMIRFITNCKSKVHRAIPEAGSLLPKECLDAEKLWWKKAQADSFPREVKYLTDKRQIPKTSRLFKLSAIMDEEAVMKMKGRINAAEVSTWTKQPIILDPKHSYTKLLLQHYHNEANHQGQEYVVNELRQKYWILHIRAAVRSTWNSCQVCKNKRATIKMPEMGPLPAVRVQAYQRPFTATGMDYFGPMDVTVGRRHEKRYGVLFTCLSTRAVHIEVASSLTTDSAIMAVRRMVSRRGCPQRIYSDNGTNLRGCDKELKNALKEFDQGRIRNKLTVKGIEWHFIPPSAPHMGGSWERLVKSIKTALKSTLHERSPRDEVLQTLLAEAECIVNSRPLTHVSVDPDDPESLTPNHFLFGSSSNVVIPGIFNDGDLCLRKQWRIAQRLTDMFWKRWIKEYLPTLTRRTKWFKDQDKNIEIGDLVIIADGDMLRNCWPRGVVTAVYPGVDKRVRVVDVKTRSGILRRPVAKLCKLDVHQKNSVAEQVDCSTRGEECSR